VRRVCLGLIMFHLAMAGILSLNKAYFLSTLLTPLPIATMVYIYNFEEHMVPLLHFIALRAIKTTGSHVVSHEDTEDDDLSPEALARIRALRRVRSQSKTLDEQREQYLTYTNPNLTKQLDGPWLGIEGDEIILANSEGTRRRRVRFEEWE
jgi:calcium permeable stress-gated cation channel